MSLEEGHPVAQGLSSKQFQLKVSLCLAVSALGLRLELVCSISVLLVSYASEGVSRASCVIGENGS